MRCRDKTADNAGHCCYSQSPEGERPDSIPFDISTAIPYSYALMLHSLQILLVQRINL